MRETVTAAASEAVEDVRDFAENAKQEVSEMAREAKAKYEAIPPAKKMELNHWVSLLIAVVIGLIIGLAFGWSRGNQRGMMMQNPMSMQEMVGAMSASLDGLEGRELEQKFIDEMIVHHQGAIDMATKLVGGPGVTNDQLRSMAANMIAAQSAEIEQMKSMQR